MDKFIMDAAREQNVRMKDSGYSSKLQEFTKEMKKIQAANDLKLRKLFDRIKGNPELQCFRNALKYLVSMRYNVDSDVAKRFFDGSIETKELRDILNSSYQ